MKIGDALYFDHQATTPLDARVLDKMRPYLEDSFGNPHSSDHNFGWRAAQAVDDASRQVAQPIGADSDEIVFTSGATEANNLALLGLARKAARDTRQNILLGACEHKSVLAVGHILKNQLGYNVKHIPVDCHGHVLLDHLDEIINDDVLLISIMAVNNEIGTIQRIKDISDIARQHGVIFHCDAAQAPSATDLTEITEHVDLLSLSAHKMYGPKGIGALYARRELQSLIEPMIYGGGQQNNLRSGTIPTALCVGMGVAAELMASTQASAERLAIASLRDQFVERLKSLPWPIEINGPMFGQDRHPGNANLRFDGFSAHEILGALQPRLAASTGSACTTGIPAPSHVLMEIGLTPDQADSSVRFSIGRFTTKQDIEEAAELVAEALSRIANAGIVQTA